MDLPVLALQVGVSGSVEGKVRNMTGKRLPLTFVLLAALVLTGCSLLHTGPTDMPTLTAMPSPSPTLSPPPTATFTIQPTATATPVPRPSLVPTVDPAVLPDLLSRSFTVQQENGVAGHPLHRVTGWEYGLRFWRPYRWLDNTHLLLYPLVGEDYDEMSGAMERTLPVVVNLNSGKTWLPALDRDSYPNPLWSDALQVLIMPRDGEILLLDADGHVVQRYTDNTRLHAGIGAFLHLSPSGRRLLVGFVWRDLETGQTVDFSGRHKWTMANPGWSSDEAKLFDCCFGYANANTGDYGYFWSGELHQVGRGGGGPLRSQWVLSDTLVMVEWDFTAADNPAIPLIDPQAQTYVDLCDAAGLSETPACATTNIFPRIAPDGEHVQVDRYIIDLRTFVTQTLSIDFGFTGWSPDGQFALLSGNWDLEREVADYQLLSVGNWNLHPVAETPIAAPTWNPQGERLAFLGENKCTLTVLDVETWMSSHVLLPQSSNRIFWRSQGDGLAVLAEDGSLWWVPDFDTGTVEPLTPPVPNIRDDSWSPAVCWSPDGEHLAFVSGTDVYVASINDTEGDDN